VEIVMAEAVPERLPALERDGGGRQASLAPVENGGLVRKLREAPQPAPDAGSGTALEIQVTVAEREHHAGLFRGPFPARPPAGEIGDAIERAGTAVLRHRATLAGGHARADGGA